MDNPGCSPDTPPRFSGLKSKPDDVTRKLFSLPNLRPRLGGSARRQALDCLTEPWHRLVNHCPPHEAQACVRRGNDSPLRGRRWRFERLSAGRIAKPHPPSKNSPIFSTKRAGAPPLTPSRSRSKHSDSQTSVRGLAVRPAGRLSTV
jgi:hypothetical protein